MKQVLTLDQERINYVYSHEISIIKLYAFINKYNQLFVLKFNNKKWFWSSFNLSREVELNFGSGMAAIDYAIKLKNIVYEFDDTREFILWASKNI